MGSTPKNYQELVAKAKLVLKANTEGSYTVPSKGLYPHQVLWDSCFIAIGMSYYDLDQAKSEIGRLLRSQWSNGMIPHIIFSKGAKYWSDPQNRKNISKQAPKKLITSGISQPPMLAEAIVAIGKQLPDTERIDWYKSVFKNVVAYHQWLVGERDPRSEGLITQIHPWETGLDTSPPCIDLVRAKTLPWWIRFLEVTNLEKIGNHFRVDTKYVEEGQRGSNIESLALYSLLRKIRKYKYDSKIILKNPYFAIQDVTYNSIFIRANNLLIEIAKVIDEKLPQELIDYSSKAHNSIDKLWDQENSQYYSREFVTGKLIKEPSIGALLPLYSGAISAKQADELVKLLDNKDSFNLNHPIPSVPTNSSWFSSTRYWQGPTWVNTNWLIIKGLKSYGFEDQARALTLSTLDLVQKSGFYEYFDPYTGEASGVNNFSWTAALVIDLAIF
jgi:hypothetical protein